jgi:hypothetical protein
MKHLGIGICIYSLGLPPIFLKQRYGLPQTARHVQESPGVGMDERYHEVIGTLCPHTARGYAIAPDFIGHRGFDVINPIPVPVDLQFGKSRLS